ncbi:MAG: hypothetical protein K8T20_03965 [Planctomycetes bacterium]|nr:hypothetical protein [Planctomycetota bacterium]
MAIIKPIGVAESSPFRVKDLDAEAALHLEKAWKDAQSILEAARVEAARIRQSAEADRKAAIDRGIAEGRAEGSEKGRAEGRLAALDSTQKALAPGAALVDCLLSSLGPALDDAIRRATADAEAGVIRLAMAIASAVVKKEVSIDPGIVRANVAAAVSLAARRGGLEIRVHPADRVLMEQYIPELAARFEGLEVARVIADESVGRGGGRVVWAEGAADADIKVQLAEIERLIVGEGKA